MVSVCVCGGGVINFLSSIWGWEEGVRGSIKNTLCVCVCVCFIFGGVVNILVTQMKMYPIRPDPHSSLKSASEILGKDRRRKGNRTKRTMDKTDQTKRTTFQDKTDHISGQNGPLSRKKGPGFRTKRAPFKDKRDHVRRSMMFHKGLKRAANTHK